jgi:xanthine/uracil permease
MKTLIVYLVRVVLICVGVGTISLLQGNLGFLTGIGAVLGVLFVVVGMLLLIGVLPLKTGEGKEQYDERRAC